MKKETIWAARRAANARQGNSLLDDPEMQKSLLFKKHANVIFDRSGELNLAYYFPSAVGSALFYYGHFELGEISLVTRVLADAPNPIVLDIGANIGSHSLEWARRLKTAQIYAFEPAPSNCDLLRRNINENHLSARVHAIDEAVAQEPGSETFFETDDAAYSSLQDTQRRPVRATYDVAVTTIDAFVERAGFREVSLIKIDVEGTEDAVLAGAAHTLGRFKPLLFVEIYGGQHSNPDPEHTIATLKALGYVPHVISDGVPTPYEVHDDNFYNYLFVHKSDRRRLPPPDLRLKRELDAERLELIDKLTADLQNAAVDVARAQRQWSRLDQAARDKEASLQEKDRALQEITKASNDLEAQLQEKDRALQEITQASRLLETQVHDKDRALRDITKASRDLARQLKDKERALQEVAKSSQALETQLREKDRALQEITHASRQLEAQLHDKEMALRDITEASQDLATQLTAKERVLQDGTNSSHDIEAQLQAKERALQEITKASHDLAAQLEDKERVLQTLLTSSHDLETQLQEKDRALQDLAKASQALEPQLREKDALIERFNHSGSAMNEQLQSLSRQVEEKQAALNRFDADLREKDTLIGRLSAELSENSTRIAELYAELEAKQALLEPMAKEIEVLREAAEERLATANELNGLAQERLAVIVSLNARLHELQGDT